MALTSTRRLEKVSLETRMLGQGWGRPGGAWLEEELGEGWMWSHDQESAKAGPCWER